MSLESLESVLRRAFADCGRQWPPRPRVIQHSSSNAAPGAQPHIVLIATSCGALADPFFAIPLPGGDICVSDHGNHRIQIVSPHGEVRQTIGNTRGRAVGQFTRPLGLAFSSSGLHVADDTDRVQLFDLDGNALPGFSSLHHKLPATAAATGPAADAEARRLSQPCGLAVGPHGRVYVADRGKHRVVCLDEHGVFAFAFGEKGSGAGQLHDPRGLAVHASQVWVADMCNHRVACFTLRGRHVRTLGQHGTGPGQFQYPAGVALAANLLFVSEYVGGRVQVLSSTGAFLQAVAAPFGGAHACALGADEHTVSVTDSASRLHVFAIARRGEHGPFAPPPAAYDAADSLGPLALALAPDPAADARAALAERRATRRGRVSLALEASDLAGVLGALKQEDVHALLPVALAHAERFPALYRLPAARSADDVVAQRSRPASPPAKAPRRG